MCSQLEAVEQRSQVDMLTLASVQFYCPTFYPPRVQLELDKKLEKSGKKRNDVIFGSVDVTSFPVLDSNACAFFHQESRNENFDRISPG